MRDTLTFQFEELPLIVADGFVAGLLNGSAEINFCDEGEWSVGAIYLEGYKDGKTAPVEVDTCSEIYLNILDHLERGRFKSLIEDEIREALEGRGVRFRSDRAEHNTMHRAYQGV